LARNKTPLSISEAESLLQKYVSIYLVTFEHECMHYVQEYALPSKYFYDELDIIAYSKHTSYYMNSQIEYHPQIVSAYGRYLDYNEVSDPEENLRLFIMQDYFFEALTVGSKKWKEAVKLLYLYIMNQEE